MLCTTVRFVRLIGFGAWLGWLAGCHGNHAILEQQSTSQADQVSVLQPYFQGWSLYSRDDSDAFVFDEARGALSQTEKPLAIYSYDVLADYAMAAPPQGSFVRLRSGKFIKAPPSANWSRGVGWPGAEKFKAKRCPVLVLDHATARATQTADTLPQPVFGGILNGRFHWVLLPDGSPRMVSKHCLTSLTRGSSEAPKYEPLPEQEYPSLLIPEHYMALAEPSYRVKVRRAAAAAQHLIWQASEPLSGTKVQQALFIMLANYTDYYYRPLIDHPTNMPHYEGGDYIWNVRNGINAIFDKDAPGLQQHLMNMVRSAPQLDQANTPPGHYPPIEEHMVEKRIYKEMNLPNAPQHALPMAVFHPAWRSDNNYTHPDAKWLQHGVVSMHPAIHYLAFERIAQLLNDIKAQQGTDATLAELAYITANMLPFGRSPNWGPLYIVHAQARRLMYGPSADRPSQGLDWYMLFAAHTTEQAVAIYYLWGAGLLDEAYYSDVGQYLRRSHH